MIKPVLKIVLAVVVLALVGGGVVVVMLLRGAGGADEWIARQITGIVNYYIVPEIQFDSFRYQAPYTVEMEGVRLVAPSGTEVVAAGGLLLELAERPRRGQPIRIERITLRDADLRLIASGDGGFEGLVPFARTSRVQEQDKAPEDRKLSNIFEIRKLTLQNGGVYYDAGDGQPPMELEGLSFSLDVEPVPDASEDEVIEAGWYALVAEAGRAPIFSMRFDGRVNIDTFIADMNTVSLRTDLSEESYGVLPPQIQSLLREREARGSLVVEASGRALLQDPMASDLTTRVTLRDFNIATGEYRLPIDSGRFEVAMRDGRANLTTGLLTLLKGSVEVTEFSADLTSPDRLARAGWIATNLDLQELLRSRPSDAPPKLAGLLTSRGNATLSLADPKSTLDGEGNLAIREGRLVNIPVLSDLLKVVQGVSSFVGLGARFQDRADLEFEFEPDQLRITTLDIVTQVAAVRGDRGNVGTLTYDGHLDILVNAGPLERVQSALGRVGQVIGRVTDFVGKYRVHGPMGDIRVQVRPLGL